MAGISETTKKQDAQSKALARSGAKTLQEKGSKDKDLYKIWRSMPSLLRMLKPEEQKMMGYDIDDPMFQRLVKCKTKREFCAEFGIGVNSPSRWESDPEFLAEVRQLSTTDHVLRFSKDVDFAFTQKAIRHGDAARVKLWKQLHEGWREEIVTTNKNLNFDVVSLVKSIEERNAKIRQSHA